jgi:AraC-like DNA-binding protein/DNA-binding XRE family transcriptional regulator
MDKLEYDYKFLKETRLAKGISSDNLAFDLCLAERQIHSIENNLPDFFYSPTIKLACIKKVAEKLGLDIDEVLYKKERIKAEEKVSEKLSIESTHVTESLAINHESQIETSKIRKSHPPGSHEKNGSNHVIIQLSVEYIRHNLSNKITMVDLTNITGYSERSLQLVFKKQFNQTPFEYIEGERLKKAKALIEAHKQSKKIAEIAQDVGLTHLGRFSVNFKKQFGISPSLLAKT